MFDRTPGDMEGDGHGGWDQCDGVGRGVGTHLDDLVRAVLELLLHKIVALWTDTDKRGGGWEYV